ncbi:ATP-grasp domain-containing protein [Paenibacillus puerhi]|uniref:ATP-grasp domain-containing protein n=1 Tax=Paenibacillus puerhi TaxID=2692622 RepID=UPI001359BA43|nr:ATP-grasp domain-containing protein [Paenibacillus puerhi]
MADNQVIPILITSAGGISGTFLLRHLSRHPIENYEYRLIAVDSNENSIARYISSVFYRVPMCDDPGYEQAITEILEKEGVKIILPVTSYDIPFYAARRDQLNRQGSKLLVCDLNTHEMLHHKRKMYACMEQLGIPVPLVYKHGETLRYPAMMKSSESSGSKGVFKLENDNDYRYWSSKLNDYVVTDFIQGTEYTVDCLFDASGRLIAFNNRDRRKTEGGGATVTRRIDASEPLLGILHKLETHLTLVGPVNFQYMVNGSGDLFITDFNTRFASGGLPLTIASGLDIPNLIIRMLLGQEVQVQRCTKEGLTMYRYYDEFFVEEV